MADVTLGKSQRQCGETEMSSNSTKLNNGISVEENPLTLNSKIEYLNGLAVKTNEPRFLISEKEQKQILNNQKFIDEYNKPYTLRVTYQELEKKLSKIKKLSFHAGCMGNPNCVLCPIMKILKNTKHSEDSP